MRRYPSLKLKIVGYAHSIEREKPQLSLERAQTVQNILANLEIDRRRLTAIARPGSPADVAANQEPWLSQCVLFEVVP
jgi:outer membrane protein OmpA-like peptidoglycan-associated protein